MYGKYIYGKYTDEGGAGAQQLADVISDFKYMGQPPLTTPQMISSLQTLTQDLYPVVKSVP